MGTCGRLTWFVAVAIAVISRPTAAAPPPDVSPPISDEHIAPAPAPTEPDGIEPPKLLKFVAASPSAAQAALKTPVHVLLTLEIGVEGRVLSASVARSAGSELDSLALEAAGQFEFAPARRNGEPIAVQIQFRYTFEPPPPEQPVEPVPPLEASTEPSIEGEEPFDQIDTDIIDDEGVIRGERIRRQATEATVNRDQGERVAGTQGDVIKSVQALGGVARAPLGTTDLVVWGASPSDTRLYVDHMPVPRLFHLGGVRSVVQNAMVQSLSLVPGGASAEYGRAIGGLVRVDTVSLPEQFDSRPVHGFVRADPIDIGAGTSAQLGSRTWLSVAGRKSVLEPALDLVVPDRPRELVPVPDYWDYSGKLTHRVSATEDIELIAVGARDRVRRGIPSITPELTVSEEQVAAFHRVGLRLRRTHVDGGVSRVDAWGGHDTTTLRQDFSSVQAYDDERSARGGLRVLQRRRVHRLVAVEAGLDGEFWRSHHERRGALSLPAREGDIVVFGQPPGDRIAADRWRVTTVQLGLYATSTVDLFQGRWSIEPGLRFEPTIVAGDRVFPVRETEPAVGYADLDLGVEPRLKMTWRPWDVFSIYAAGGHYRQPAASRDLSPVFGTPVLDSPRAWQALGGVDVHPWTWLQVSGAGFLAEQDRLSVRAASPTPPTAAVLASSGRGRNYGAQAQARVRFHEHVFGWVTYSWIVATRHGANPPWRPFDGDQTHNVQAVASWRHRLGFELGARAVLASGFPRTPVVDAVYDARHGRYDPVFGEHNSERLPWFFQLSVRVGWQHEWSALAFRVWLDVQNATNHTNVEEVFYSADYRQRGYIEGLPVLPLLGLELSR